MKNHKKEREIQKELVACNRELEKFVRSLVFAQNEDNKFSRKNYPNIFKVYERHHGLCDLMCNYFTLVNAGEIQDKNKLIDNFKIMNANKKMFNYGKMEELSKTHILSLVSFIELVKFVFLKSVPESIFTNAEQKRLRLADRSLDQNLLHERLDSLPQGAYVKFAVFKTEWGVPGTGHAMLISKMGKDQYMFFDPDSILPTCKFYNSKELCKELSFKSTFHDRVAFIDNQKFMQRVEKNLFALNHVEKQKDIKENLKQVRVEKEESQPKVKL